MHWAIEPELFLGCWMQEPGVYPCTVTLTSDIDVRIYQFEGGVEYVQMYMYIHSIIE